MRKSKFGVMLFIVLSLLPLTTAYQYSPQFVEDNYPLIYYVDGNSNSHASEYTSSASYSTRVTISRGQKGVGPPAPYNGSDELLFPQRRGSGNNNDYLFFGNRTDDTVAQVTAKPKQNTGMATAYIEKDGKPDIIFRDASDSGEVTGADTDGVSTRFGFVGNPIDVADLDKDGFQELLYYDTGDSSVKYDNFRSNDTGGTNSTVDPGDVSKKGFSTLVDFDQDGDLEYVYRDGNQNIELADMDGHERQISSTTSGKNKPIATIFAEGEPRAIAALGDSRMDECTLTQCTDISIDTPEKMKGARSFIPPMMSGPTTNRSDGVVSRGSTVSVSFNVTDLEGYTDIVAETANITFSDGNGTVYDKSSSQVTLRETTHDVIPSYNRSGGVVPADSVSRSFTADFNTKETTSLGNWTAKASIKDSHFVGVQNQTTFTVEKGVAERNVSQPVQYASPKNRRGDFDLLSALQINWEDPNSKSGATTRFTPLTLTVSKAPAISQSLYPLLPTRFVVQSGKDNEKATFTLLPEALTVSSFDDSVKSTLAGITQGLNLDTIEGDIITFSETVIDVYTVNTTVQGPSNARTIELGIGVASTSQAQQLASRILQTAVTTTDDVLAYQTLGRDNAENLVVSQDSLIVYDGVRTLSQALSISPTIQLRQTVGRLIQASIGLNETPFRTTTQARVDSQGLIAGASTARNLQIGRGVNNTVLAGSVTLGGAFRTVEYALSVIGSDLDRNTVSIRNIVQTVTAEQTFDDVLEAFVSDQTNIRADASLENTQVSTRTVDANILTAASFRSRIAITRAVLGTFTSSFSPTRRTTASRQQDNLVSAAFTTSEDLSLFTRLLVTDYVSSITSDGLEGSLAEVVEYIGVGDTVQRDSTLSRADQAMISPTITSGATTLYSRTIYQGVTVGLGLDDLIEYILDLFRDDDQEEDQDSTGSDDSVSSNTPVQSPGSPSGANSTSTAENETDQTTQKDPSTEAPTSTQPEQETILLQDQINPASSGEPTTINLQGDAATKTGLETIQIDTPNQTEQIPLTIKESKARSDDIEAYESLNITTNGTVSNATINWSVPISFPEQHNTTRDNIVVRRWDDGSQKTLPTNTSRQNTSHYLVEARSSSGFSIFTVGITERQDQNASAPRTDRKDPATGKIMLEDLPMVTVLQLTIVAAAVLLFLQSTIPSVKGLRVARKALLNMQIIALRIYKYVLKHRLSNTYKEKHDLDRDVDEARQRKHNLKGQLQEKRERVHTAKDVLADYIVAYKRVSDKIKEWKDKLID